jgi:hypothetical protein
MDYFNVSLKKASIRGLAYVDNSWGALYEMFQIIGKLGICVSEGVRKGQMKHAGSDERSKILKHETCAYEGSSTL